MVTNIINGKIYIGKTTRTIEKRWKQHCGDKTNDYFHNAIRKYKPENFYIQKIDECNCENFLNYIESLWIFLYNSTDRAIGYNLRSGGQGGTFSQETKQKMSEMRKGENAYWFGKNLPEEMKNKISRSLRKESNDFSRWRNCA